MSWRMQCRPADTNTEQHCIHDHTKSGHQATPFSQTLDALADIVAVDVAPETAALLCWILSAVAILHASRDR